MQAWTGLSSRRRGFESRRGHPCNSLTSANVLIISTLARRTFVRDDPAHLQRHTSAGTYRGR